VYKTNLLPKVQLKEEQFVQIDQTLGLDECAVDYQAKVLKSFGLAADSTEVPQFDLLLLGMGPDGHTCSLFPGHGLLTERKRLIAPIHDSPKPPPKRVTMTYALLDRAKNVIFAMAGAGKAEMVTRIIKNGEKFPAGMVASQPEPLWILDQAAAVNLA
jgi:6-phosphogluconolactonase